MVIVSPESSFRGFRTGWAGFAADGSEVVARVRRDRSFTGSFAVGILDVVEAPGLLLRAEGARKSRYRGFEVATALALVYVLDAVCVMDEDV